ncbi:MAG TPA: cell envelope biogenesis protein OmpA [Piscirickettsiaceae bacterium]|nr:cell envelope biogenesis protein OmpA [Piscirickettsiaceae bacterium]
MDPQTAQQTSEQTQVRFQRIWLMAYVALFSSLLAFFIVLITQVPLEGIVEKRAHQQLTQQLYQDVKNMTQQMGLSDWLAVENVFPKGVRVYPRAALFSRQSLFAPARAQLNPRFRPYVDSIGRMLRRLELAQFQQRYAPFIQPIEARGYRVLLTLRVEGHTDANPLHPNAPFKDNVTLSVFRAYTIMRLLKQASLLPDAFWGIAGYGAMHPLFPDPTDPRNRRVELLIQPQMTILEGEDGAV